MQAAVAFEDWTRVVTVVVLEIFLLSDAAPDHLVEKIVLAVARF